MRTHAGLQAAFLNVGQSKKDNPALIATHNLLTHIAKCNPKVTTEIS